MFRVLHIEDDEGSRTLVRKVLNSAGGFSIVEAADGITGIRMALEAKPHIILLDINLPDMDGYEVTLKLRGELSGRNVPIVALTGEGNREMSLAVGCDGYILKPIDISSLPGDVASPLMIRSLSSPTTITLEIPFNQVETCRSSEAKRIPSEKGSSRA